MNKSLLFIFLAILVCVISSCSSSTQVASSVTTQAEATSRMRALLPDQEYATYQSILAQSSGQSDYGVKIAQLDSVAGVITNALNNYTSGLAKPSKSPVILSTPLTPAALSAEVEQVRSTLTSQLGDIYGTARQTFFDQGYGYGEGLYGEATGSLSGTLVIGVGLDLTLGTGFENVYDFKDFTSSPFNSSYASGGVTIDGGDGGGANGGVTGIYFSDFIHGFKSGISDFEGVSIGGTCGLSAELEALLGADVGPQVGLWTSSKCACSVLGCNTLDGPLAGLNLGFGVGVTVGPAVKGDVGLTISGSRSCTSASSGSKIYLSSNDQSSLDCFLAGSEMASDILLYTFPSNALIGFVNPFSLPAAALAFLHGVLRIAPAPSPVLLSEDFEEGSSMDSRISVISTKNFTTNPGIMSITQFGGSHAFGFGMSACAANCFSNYQTTLHITFPSPTYVSTVSFKEMELYGNWGSTGYAYADGVSIISADESESGSKQIWGRVPENDRIADKTYRRHIYSVDKAVTTIDLTVSDITKESELFLDDLIISGQ